MAVFNLGSGTDLNNLDDLQKVKSYLYKLTEQLKYMFNNLTPEDNYSTNAQLIYAADKERQATLEVSLDAIRATYITQEGVESAIKLSEDQAAMTYSTKDGTKAALELSEQQAALTYVAKTGVVSAINLSQEGAKIKANKITLEGVVTANQNFKILLDGSIEAKNAKFSGNITGSNISGSSLTLGGANNANGTLTVKNAQGQVIGTWANAGLNITSGAISGTTINGGTINGSHIYGSYYGSRTSNNFFIIAEDGTTVVGVPGFEFKSKKMSSDWIGSIENPALDTDQAGISGSNGKAGFRDLFLLDNWFVGGTGPRESGTHLWGVTETLIWLAGRLDTIESECWQHSSGGGCGSDGSCSCDNDDSFDYEDGPVNSDGSCGPESAECPFDGCSPEGCGSY